MALKNMGKHITWIHREPVSKPTRNYAKQNSVNVSRDIVCTYIVHEQLRAIDGYEIYISCCGNILDDTLSFRGYPIENVLFYYLHHCVL